MPAYSHVHPSDSKPSTYSATITTDQIIITRHEYNSLVETKLRLEHAAATISDLKAEVVMLKDVILRVMDHYDSNSNGVANLAGPRMNGGSQINRNEESKTRSKSTKVPPRRDSGVDGIGMVQHDGDESDRRSSNRGSLDNTKSHFISRTDPVSIARPKSTETNELNLLDLDEVFHQPMGSPRPGSKSTVRNGKYDSTDNQVQNKSQLFTGSASNRPTVSPPAPPTSAPSAPPGYPEPGKWMPPPQSPVRAGYESPDEEEVDRAPTPASWEQTASHPKVTFDDFNAEDDNWKKLAEWDPAPGKGKKTETALEQPIVAESSRPGLPPVQAVKPHLRALLNNSPVGLKDKVDDSSPSTPPPTIISTGPKTARQLFMEKRRLTLALLAESRTEANATSSAASSSGDMDKIMAEPDPSTFRHVYIPNLPSNATLSTLTSIIRTNGQGGVEFVSLFRQKAEGGDYLNFEEPGTGENIGVNITFTTAEACDAWFKFLFENSSQKLQGNPVKTWLFANEDSAGEWRKSAVFRRSDYHPSIAGKIDKGGPGGQAQLADAQKRGATRVLLITGLPPDVTENDLAWLALPPGNRSLPYDGPTHLASGQASLSTEEFARWKWLERIVIEDEEQLGFGDGLERRKTAKIYTAGVKTAYLARGKIWKKYNKSGTMLGKSSGSYVKVEFLRDDCEGPLEELPPWVVVGGDDDDSEMGLEGEVEE